MFRYVKNASVKINPKKVVSNLSSANTSMRSDNVLIEEICILDGFNWKCHFIFLLSCYRDFGPAIKSVAPNTQNNNSPRDCSSGSKRFVEKSSGQFNIQMLLIVTDPIFGRANIWWLIDCILLSGTAHKCSGYIGRMWSHVWDCCRNERI